MAYPGYDDIEGPLLRYIYEHGGSSFEVRANSTYESLADVFRLTEIERKRSRGEAHGDGRDEPVWNNMVQWARRQLKKQGYLAPSSHGKWRLSPEGVQAAKRIGAKISN